jgi:Domain of unknown function (DUF4129)
VPARIAAETRAAPSASIGLQTYEAELERYSDAIERHKANRAEIAQIRASLPREWMVQENGVTYRVSTEAIVSALEGMEARPNESSAMARDVEARLSEMRQSAFSMAPHGSGSDSDAHGKLNAILASREFRGLKGPSQLELLEQRISERIANFLLRLFSRMHIRQSTGNVIAWTIIALAFLAIAYWVYRILSRPREAEFIVELNPGAFASDSREWVQEALAAAERGDYRQSVHRAYWATIARLEELNLLKKDRARTPRESLRLLDRNPSEQASLRSMTHHFELIWYGYRPASEADWSEAKSLLEKFGCLAASTTPTANS